MVDGTLEEVLWRGVYVREFPRQIVLGYLYPSLGFAVWHHKRFIQTLCTAARRHS
jgi:membrane protease YdiL (CAAX protease family)